MSEFSKRIRGAWSVLRGHSTMYRCLVFGAGYGEKGGHEGVFFDNIILETPVTPQQIDEAGGSSGFARLVEGSDIWEAGAQIWETRSDA